jgi:proline iminopeptidase
MVAALALAASASCTTPPTIEDGYIDTNGTMLYYKTMGTGEPIVVLHGGPGFDHQQFLPFIWELATDYKVILYDQRGTGLSSGPVDSASITIDNFIEDIEGIRRAFGIEGMNLLGHSWGGMLAMHYGIRHPDKLRSLVLCSTAASAESFGDMQEAKLRNWLPEDIERFESIAASEAFQNNDRQAIEEFWRVYFKAYFVDQALVAEMNLTFTDNTIQHSNAVAGHILNSVGAFDLHGELGVISAPTLVIHGDSDPMPVSYAERIHESMPGSQLVIAENSGHWLFIDATEQFRSSVAGFLERVSDR